MDILDTLTNHILETTFEDLPSDAIEAAKKQVLDTLAAAVAGSTCDISGEIGGLAQMVKEWGGKEESSILAFGGRVPACNAAFVNGTLCVRLDFDDTFAMMVRNHPSRAVIPVAFAVAEKLGNVSGKQLLTAIVLGHDLACRMKLAVGHDVESPLGMVTNFFGATATAGKLMGLNKEGLKNAMGICFHLVSGARTGMGTAGAGASLKGINNGIVCKTGVLSALLAEKGFGSSWDFLQPENKNNFYAVFYNNLYYPSILLMDLGRVFMNTKTSMKEFPCCHGQHPALEATLSLVRKHKIKPSEVKEVQLYLGPVDFFLLANPIEKKQNPENVIEAQFSLCWGVASAIALGTVSLENFSPQALGRAEIRELARRIRAKMVIDYAGPIHAPCKVEIGTTDGKTYIAEHSQPIYGSPHNPMSFHDIEKKFKACCRYSIKPIPEADQELVVDLVREMEKIDDAGRIARLLS
jgi:2-methylcitrate dehydratase PrpD